MQCKQIDFVKANTAKQQNNLMHNNNNHNNNKSTVDVYSVKYLAFFEHCNSFNNPNRLKQAMNVSN